MKDALYTVVGNVLHSYANQHRNMVVVDSRVTVPLAKPFARDLPERYISCGYALSAALPFAAGMALAGARPFVVANSSVLSGRAFELIRTSISAACLPVTLIGIVSDDSFSDVGLMSSLSHMHVYQPTTEKEIQAVIKKTIESHQPTYIRVPMMKKGEIEEEGVGDMTKSLLYGDGCDIGFISTGRMMGECLDALEFLKQKSIYGRALNCVSLSPLDQQAVIEVAKECKVIVTVEDCYAHAGLGAMVSSVLTAEYPRDVFKIGVPREKVIHADFVDADKLVEKVVSWWQQLGYH